MDLIVSHNSRTKFTKVALGKHFTTAKSKKLTDDDLWPMLLVISDLNLKIQVSYNKARNKYEIDINGESYLRLPYEAPTFDPDRANSEALFAKISIN